MMGCQSESSSTYHSSSTLAHYSLASHLRQQETLSFSQSDTVRNIQPSYCVNAPPPLPSARCHQASHRPVVSHTSENSAAFQQPSPIGPLDFPTRSYPSGPPDSCIQQREQQRTFGGEELSISDPQVCSAASASDSRPWPVGSSTRSSLSPQLKLSHPAVQGQVRHSALPSAQRPCVSDPAALQEARVPQHLEEQQQCSCSPAISLLRPPPIFTGRSSESVCVSVDSASPYSRSSVIQQPKAGGAQDHLGQQQHPETLSPALQFQLSPLTSPSATMLDKKPALQVVTTDHSPISPGSSATSSPRFVFPDMQASSSSGHLGSESGSSPFMSPVKHEVKLEIGTTTEALEMEQGRRGRRRICSRGDIEASETLVDSETGSSILEESSSSREQSPFSAMAESLSLSSPSPLARKVAPHLPHHTHQPHSLSVASEEEEPADREKAEEGTGDCTASQPDQHHSKFKRRLHERYVLSLKSDVDDNAQLRVKEESSEKCGESSETDSHSDSKRTLSKMERSESPLNTDSPMPKSPRRSSSDTDMVQPESGEIGGASSADEGDVFMEPTMRATRTKHKHKPPSLHQREPLDLSRSPLFTGFRSSSGSSPLLPDADHLSPASKMYSPVFRSPHRLPYSPHGLMSPQSQSPLCSVPEGGRIFNFNVPSPHEGPHSDSDLISPSPMSPRIFTFPPPGSIPNPMAEVNRLAVSPRAPYTPPPSFLQGKAGGSGGGMVGEQQGFYSKRSLSESDVSYLCPVCGQVFPTNDNLAKHMSKHLPSETARAGAVTDSNKVHYCKVCNRSFSRSDMLTRHMRLHTGLKPYECVECGQVFSRSDHLNTHRRTHTGEKPYRCPHCPYAACRRDMITRHMRTHSKRSSRRARYLAVPDDADGHKASGSVSSIDTVDSQDYSTGAHTCSVSSVDSVESESLRSPGHPLSYLEASVDSLLSPGPNSSSPSSSRKPSEELDEGVVEGAGVPGGYGRFMQYRKGRNWSTTSLESVDSEEAGLIREALVDDAFHDPEPQLSSSGDGGGNGEGMGLSSTETGGLDTKTLQKCFISFQPTAGGSGSS